MLRKTLMLALNSVELAMITKDAGGELIAISALKHFLTLPLRLHSRYRRVADRYLCFEALSKRLTRDVRSWFDRVWAVLWVPNVFRFRMFICTGPESDSKALLSDFLKEVPTFSAFVSPFFANVFPLDSFSVSQFLGSFTFRTITCMHSL